MRPAPNIIQDHQNSKPPLFSPFANRINYLQQKNNDVNKKLLAYVNNFQRRLLSERSNDSGSKDKSSPTFRINPSKKVPPSKVDSGRFFSENTTSNGPKLSQRNYNTESENKENQISNGQNQKPKKAMGFQLSQSNSRNKDSTEASIPIETLKRGKKMLVKVEVRKPFNTSVAHEQQPRVTVKTDNFLKTLSKFTQQKSPYTQIMSCLKSKKQPKKHDPQKLKLIEIKKKLLQEEQKSLMEYEKCILYKQKLAQKIKYEGLGQVPVSDGKRPYEQSEVTIHTHTEHNHK